MKDNILPILTVLAVVALSLCVGYLSHVPVKDFGTTNVAIYTPVKSTGVLCGTTSTLLVATSTTGRNLFTVSNDSAQSVFLGLGVPAVAYQGTLVAASSTWVMNSNGSYAGSIYCMGLGVAASTSVSDSQS